jgi:hypothetical protein
LPFSNRVSAAILSRTPEWARLAGKERWRQDRAAAKTMREVYPKLAQMRIELTFVEAVARVPAAQSHVMHPPARAFFQFPCPYAACEGRFDLTPSANLIFSSAAARKSGNLECTGVRPKGGALKQPCGVQARYTIVAEFHAETGSHT